MSVLEYLHKHATTRNLVVVWACAMITIVILRVTRPEVMTQISTPAAGVVTAVIGILATALRFHQKRKVKG